MIRATLTRPTSIAATSSCDQKVSLVEVVDIGPMTAPKPRTISLEPISRRSKQSTKSVSSKSKSKADKGATVVADVLDGPRPSSSPIPEDSASQRPSSDNGVPLRSPVVSDVQSETSGESVVSSSTGLSYRIGPVSPGVSGRESHGGISNGSISGKTITATIELLKAGCLPGDSIPVRVSIQHTKFIKSMHGIIITLYRQGRIDSAPPLSLFTDIKGKAAERLKHEEYYPKSKTGLGGLSLSSAGSSSVFRKDLSQTFAPIIIDPSTFTTVVTASIRVPEDVFPTITGVPGQMISFRYHIEVVVDLGGKLAGQEKHVPRLGMIGSFTNNGVQMSGRDGAGTVAAWGGSIVDTDHIRREKSVVACLFEITVGTTDSARLRGRGNTFSGTQAKSQSLSTPQPTTPATDPVNELGRRQDNMMKGTPLESDQSYFPNPQYAGPLSRTNTQPYRYEDCDPNHGTIRQSQSPQPPAFVSVPLPEVPVEDGLTEKDRIRRAEERLLPSQPPQDDGPSSSSLVPTAPPDPTGDMYWSTHQATYSNSVTAGSGPTPPNYSPALPEAPSAPGPSEFTPSATTNAPEDKQELERRRLMAEASSPSDFPDEAENPGEGSSVNQHEATAPVLTEEDEYGSHYTSTSAHQEGLPRYER